MPRNSTGTYSLPENPFVAGTIIESAKVNTNNADIATALTQSLATTGVSTMSGQFKAAAGSVASPGIVFAGSLTTGFYRSAADEISWAAAGTQKGVFDANGNVTLSGNLSVGGTFAVTGAVTLSGAFTVGGLFTASGDLNVVGSASFSDNVRVAGTVSMGSGVVNGNLTVVSSINTTATNVLVLGATVSIVGGLIVAGSISAAGVTPGRIIAIIEDIQSTGTLAQAFSTDTNNVRVLNTLSYNFSTIVTLASNTFSINRPGAYEITWFCPTNTANTGGKHQSFLHNITSSAEIKRGTSGRVDLGDTDDGDTTLSEGSTVVAITGTTSYDVRHWTELNNLRGGETASNGSEVYARVVIRAA